jgi:hypothetical protein
VDYNVTDRLGVFARYDMLDPNNDIDNNETTLIMVGFNGMLYMNDKSGARWNLELSEKDVQTAPSTSTKSKRGLLQITWAF